MLMRSVAVVAVLLLLLLPVHLPTCLTCCVLIAAQRQLLAAGTQPPEPL